MSHLEERLQHDLDEIREQIARMGADVLKELKHAFKALHKADDRLAFKTILSDLPINRAMRRIDRLCHAFIAVHLPSAGHLRLISSVIRANIILERIGDYAVTIAREAVQLGHVPEGYMADELEQISHDAIRVLEEAITAFNNSDVEHARNAIALANRVEHDMDRNYAELLDCGDSGGGCGRNTMIYLIIFSQLKRVADQAKNLAEEAIFVETGETKKPKVYRILFLDRDNSCIGPMTALIAEKIYPGIGQYSSAGIEPADALDENMVRFMRGRGFDLTGVRPLALDGSREHLSTYHVIVGLNQKVLDAIERIPFRTSALNWKKLDIPDGGGPEDWEALHRNIALHIRELIDLLHGEEAN